MRRSDEERLNRDRLAGHGVQVGLGEARRIGGRARSLSVGIESVRAGEGPVFVVERAVLVEDDEDVLDLAPQRLDVLASTNPGWSSEGPSR